MILKFLLLAVAISRSSAKSMNGTKQCLMGAMSDMRTCTLDACSTYTDDIVSRSLEYQNSQVATVADAMDASNAFVFFTKAPFMAFDALVDETRKSLGMNGNLTFSWTDGRFNGTVSCDNSLLAAFKFFEKSNAGLLGLTAVEVVAPTVKILHTLGVQGMNASWTYKDEDTTKFTQVLFTPTEINDLKSYFMQYGSESLEMDCDIDFWLQRDDSAPPHVIKILRLDTWGIVTVRFDGANSNHNHLEWGSIPCKTIVCDTRVGSNCGGFPENLIVDGIVTEITADPRGGSAHANQFNRSKYSWKGSKYLANIVERTERMPRQIGTECFLSPQAHAITGAYTREWIFNNEKTESFDLTIFSDEEIKALIYQVRWYGVDSVGVDCDIDFRVQRDDSYPPHKVYILRLDTLVESVISFNSGYSDHTNLKWGSKQCMSLLCTVSGSNCNGFPTGREIPAVVKRVVFNPRGGSAHAGDYSRSRYTWKGDKYFLHL